MALEVSRNYLKKETQEFDLETIFILNLSGKQIQNVGSIGECTNLVHLNLSYNNLTSVMALHTLAQLQRLNLFGSETMKCPLLQRCSTIAQSQETAE